MARVSGMIRKLVELPEGTEKAITPLFLYKMYKGAGPIQQIYVLGWKIYSFITLFLYKHHVRTNNTDFIQKNQRGCHQDM